MHKIVPLECVCELRCSHAENEREREIEREREDRERERKNYKERYRGQERENRAVVVAQLVKWLLPIPEVCGSIPVIGKIYIENLFTCLLSTVLKRQK